MKCWQLSFATTAAIAVAQTYGKSEGSAIAATMTINTLQWNPHWECFEKDAECKSEVMKSLSSRLVNGTDFANVVELETTDFISPSGWENVSSTCGRDMTTLFFDSTRWQKSESLKSGDKGCMVTNDRAYVVQTFEHRTENLKIIVIGAHFPHREIGSALVGSLQAVAYATGVNSTLLVADTNINRPNAWPLCPESLCRSSVDIFKAIGVAQTQHIISTDLVKSCCLNPPYGFSFEFDRIITNFGTSMTTELQDDPAPSWAVGAFHKALIGRLVVPLRMHNATSAMLV